MLKKIYELFTDTKSILFHIMYFVSRNQLFTGQNSSCDLTTAFCWGPSYDTNSISLHALVTYETRPPEKNSFGDAAKSLSEPDTADSLAENDNRVECNTSTGQKYSCGDSQLPHYFGLSVQKMDIINSKGR